MACHGPAGPAHQPHTREPAAAGHHGGEALDHNGDRNAAGSVVDCYVTVLLAFGLGAVVWALLSGGFPARTVPPWPPHVADPQPAGSLPPRAPTAPLLQVFRL